MILGKLYPGHLERGMRPLPIQPRRRDEARDRPPDNILEQRPPVTDPSFRFRGIKAEKLPFARGHMLRLEARRAGVRPGVAVEPAVEENLVPAVGQRAQSRRERSAGSDRRLAPMVRHHEQSRRLNTERREPVVERTECALAARADVVDRGEKEALVHIRQIGRARHTPKLKSRKCAAHLPFIAHQA